MRFRDSLAINVTPIVLRLVLGITFLWAGYGKVFVETPYTPAQIATLDAMRSGDALPSNGDDPADGVPDPGDVDPGAETPGTDSLTPEAPLPEPDSDADAEGEGANDGDDPVAFVPAVLDESSAHRFLLAQDSAAEGEDEVNQFSRPGLYQVALMIEQTRLLPEFTWSGKWPIRLAWAAALTELLGGVFILLGFLTRLNAIGLGATMLTAMWMTSIGPVVMQDAPSSFWILPALNDFAVDAWRTWLWQLSLFGISLSILLSGPGALSADRFLLGRRASKKARPQSGAVPKPKPKPALADD